MTWKRATMGVGLAFLCLGICIGALRLSVWGLGEDVRGAALIDGPQVFVWDHDDPAFGGLSGLLIEGESLLTASDKGMLFQARLQRTSNGWIDMVDEARAIAVPTAQGRPTDEFKGDLEGLARLNDGRMMLAFESYTRLEILPALGDVPQSTHRWDRFRAEFGNEAFEGIATLPDGRVLAILEGDLKAPATTAHLYDGTTWSDAVMMPLSEGFVIVGADMGPDGCLYLLDRRYTLAGGFAHRLRRVRRLDELGEVIYHSAPADLGNAEGLSVNALESGEIFATLITDDGFLPFTPTRLISYHIAPSMMCDGVF